MLSVTKLNLVHCVEYIQFYRSYSGVHRRIRAPFRLKMVIVDIGFHLFKRWTSVAAFWNYCNVFHNLRLMLIFFSFVLILNPFLVTQLFISVRIFEGIKWSAVRGKRLTHCIVIKQIINIKNISTETLWTFPNSSL